MGQPHSNIRHVAVAGPSGTTNWDTSQLYTTGVLAVIAPMILGDYNRNGAVNAADYSVWRDGLGAMYTQADYAVWKSHFGQTAASGAALLAADPLSAAVPEPRALALLCIACAALTSSRHVRVDDSSTNGNATRRYRANQRFLVFKELAHV
jgi:hypothetical protein